MTQTPGGSPISRVNKMPPYWSQVLRALREARGVTRSGWAASLGVGRTTVQRWETGEAVPDAMAEQAIVARCQQRGLYRSYDAGPLRGQTLTADLLQTMLAEARLGRIAGDPHSGPRAEAASFAESREGQSNIGMPPAPSTLRPGNVPAPVTTFVGRDEELAEVARLLDRTRLLTLTGPGGSGKTRLALEAAAGLPGFPDGIFFVGLASVADPGLVASVIAQVLDVRETGSQPVVDLLKTRLRQRRVLLILDNFEHVLGAAPLVSELLAACRWLQVLVTSRAPLHLQGEQELAVLPLPVPTLDPLPPFELFAEYAAVALFVARARAVKPDFALTHENSLAVAWICQQLDGLPLAIELAAARSKVLSPSALLARLDQRLPLLTGGARDLPLRQQTLRGTIAWSYDLLDEGERKLFRRLAVFAGGCSLEAAQAVCNPAGALKPDIEDGLAVLVDRSLLGQEERPDGEPRFRMLQTVREFAEEQLEQYGEAIGIRTALLHYLRRMASPVLHGFADIDHVTWLRQMEAEIDNVRAALAWTLVEPDAAYAGLALAGVLQPLWAQAHLQEGCSWLERLLQRGTGAGTPARAGALLTAAQLVMYRSGYAASLPLIEECIDLSGSLGRLATLAQGLCLKSEGFRINATEARSAAEAAVALALKQGDPVTFLRSYLVLGTVACWQGDLGVARTALEEAVTWGQRSGLHEMTGAPLRELGNVAYREGDYVTARRLLKESIALLEEVGVDAITAQTLPILGRVALAEGDLEEATEWFQRTLVIERETGSVAFVALAVSGLAMVALGWHQPEHAARLYGAAEALGETTTSPMGSLYQDEHAERIVSLRAQLGGEVFNAAWATGRAISLKDVLNGVFPELAIA